MALRKLPPLALALAVAAGLAACAEDPLQPLTREAPKPLFNVAGPTAQQAVTQHVVVFKGSAPKDFDAQVTKLGGTVLLNHKIGIAVVSGLDEATAAQLKKNVTADFVEEQPEFQLVEPAAVAQPTMAELPEVAVAAAEPASPTNPASAIYFADQWNMRLVKADVAWAKGRLGSSRVRVAILDTGIDYLLPDLAGRVDLSRSTSFEPLDDLYAAVYFPTRHRSTDLHYHGTNVATQVASNAVVFAGVTSQTTLMSVKVCSFLGGCHGVIQGILYAIDNGADVINMSLGGWFNKSAYPGMVSTFNTIMNYAKQQGVTVVVAAGNDGNDLDRANNIAIRDSKGEIIERIHVPSFFATYCSATQVICVSATRDHDVPAAYTNYGRSSIDVAAPGGDRLKGVYEEWVYSLCPQSSLFYDCRNGFYVLGVAGTSQATPHVSGLAALAVQDVGRNPAQVRAYIRNSADVIAGNGGNSPYYGNGRINVARAVGAQ